MYLRTAIVLQRSLFRSPTMAHSCALIADGTLASHLSRFPRFGASASSAPPAPLWCISPDNVWQVKNRSMHAPVYSSTIPLWWSDGDSNPGPAACKAAALPSELSPRNKARIEKGSILYMVGVGGLEPPTSILSGSRSNLLSYTPSSVLYHTRAKHATLHSRDDKIPR